MKTLVIASDHAGFRLKESLKLFIRQEWPDWELKDLGTYSEESTDYPLYAGPAARIVSEGSADMGIVICGSGNGVSITANKHKGVRCVLAWKAEIARLGRAHNNANMLALPARFISEEEAKEILFAFMNTAFEGGRHARRVEQIEGGC
jgi:ribose 5-phosphate isomerase B